MNFLFFSQVLVVAVLLVLSLPGESHAYIDPGTGSLIVQSVVAAVVGGLMIAKVYWHKLKSLFSKKEDRSPTAEDSEHNE